MAEMRGSFIGMVLSFYIGGVTCLISRSMSAVEGESLTIDCGFQTSVDGGNLMWQVISTDSKTLLGHIVPGDRFCGTDTVACTVDSNGSITLVDVTVDDGDKRYRCLRGDTEGYDYFSDFDLTVLAKESVGHPVIKPPTGSIANVYKIGEKGVIHSYEQPTCEDKEDGTLIVTCYPPSGLMVDKVYDHIHCNCTDSDGNANSLNIAVNRTNNHPVINSVTESMHESYTMGEENVVYSFYSPTCKDDEDGDLIVTCFPPSGVIVDKAEVPCSCTDSDGNSVSRNITVNSHIELTTDCTLAIGITLVVTSALCVMIVIFIFLYFYKKCKDIISRNQEHSTECCLIGFAQKFKCKIIEGGAVRQPLNTLDQRLADKIAECDRLKAEIEKKNTLDQRLAEKIAECDRLKAEIEKKDKEIADLKQEPTEKEVECKTKDEGTKRLEKAKQLQLQKDEEKVESQLPPSGKQTSGDDSVRRRQTKNRRKSQDAERRLTLSGQTMSAPEDQTQGVTCDPDLESSQPMNGSELNSTLKNNSGLDEPDSYHIWREFLIKDDIYEGFNLDFTCNGPGLKIELRDSENKTGNIYSIVFDESSVMLKSRENQKEGILLSPGETSFGLLLANKNTVLSLYKGSDQTQACVSENVDIRNCRLRLLCMYKDESCQVSILGTVNLTPLQ